MRLFLLPISTRQSLIYCQRLNQQLSAETTYIDKITTKSSRVWLDWEKKDKGWKKKVTSYGNTLFQRLPFEEWGLKSVPPLSARRKKEEIEGKKEVQVVYPGQSIDPGKVQDVLQMYGSDAKQGFHTKWMWGSIIGMPLSAPFALIPLWVTLKPCVGLLCCLDIVLTELMAVYPTYHSSISASAHGLTGEVSVKSSLKIGFND